MEPEPPAEFVTVRQAAERLAVSPGLVYLLIRRGELAACRFGSAVRIPAADLANFVRRSRVGPEASNSVLQTPSAPSAPSAPSPRRPDGREPAPGFRFLTLADLGLADPKPKGPTDAGA